MINKLFSLLLFFLAVGCSLERKEDVGAIIRQLPSPAKSESGEPFLTTSHEGVVYLSWIEARNDSSFLKYSYLNEDQWAEPITISLGRNWFVNWADYPVIAINDKAIMAHFLERSGDSPYAYDVKLVASSDSGIHWTTPSRLHDDGKEAEHGFVTILPYKEDFFITWLDGRNTVMEGMEEHEGHHGVMTLRAAIIDRTGKKLNEWELDDRTCDCCQTTAAITAAGPVVLYRDRSGEEIRDISITRLVNDQWTTPEAIHHDGWKINGCPVNGPHVAASNQLVAVAWFTAPSDSSRVNVAFSRDQGKTFENPIQVNDSTTIGRVDIEILDEESASVSWMEGDKIKVARVYFDGRKEKPLIVATSSSTRSSGFPQMTRRGDQLIFAWTDDDVKTVRLATLKF
ncbi:MAG: exo-alpha-sialidase [Cyclobacteriaceae bacterium]|nr:exo-alpha-sialidase [Cyclobacteriaceae bacterium]